jgi:hypothetical protein
MSLLLSIVICLATSICLIIDTSGWWLRSFSNGNNMGVFVSRTNIYTYSARLFSFLYMSLLSFKIELGADLQDISALVTASFILGAVAHKMTLNASHLSSRGLGALARLMKLDSLDRAPRRAQLPYGAKLRATTAAATTVFCLGMSAPYMLAAALPDFRLTLASTGQILNAVGMIFILFFVDQMLYKSWDADELGSAVYYYTDGRILGIIFAAFIATIVFLFTKVQL